MATKKTVKKAVKLVKPMVRDDTFIAVDDCGETEAENTTEEGVLKTIAEAVKADSGDRYYEGREYGIYKLVKRVRVQIEQPQPVVKLIPVKD